ncbi:energy-coupling factor transporter transmembrane component T family protein [Limosilactobacillus caecicola]|uniref:energy-coupling factor transporter transmembrane component T family protein n=1 Tax=Limosilactobacillus caecicola TaxID=2941332 RepID=UPI00203B4BB3|nr:energy-coupling factor transporter transmembrane component T [Limosilactobacillus caecicola]
MNPSLKLLLVIIISLEISFTNKIVVNLLLIGIALVDLLCHKVKWQTLARLILLPLFPALVIAITIRWFSPGHSTFYALVMVSRLYAYCFLGAVVTTSTSLLELAHSLEQNAHLPAKFAYGTLAAINLIPKTIQEVKTIRVAAQMRGIMLHFWSPQLYFKAILSALKWSDDLAQAMESQGFVEGQPRTHARIIRVRPLDWFITASSLILLQTGLIWLP